MAEEKSEVCTVTGNVATVIEEEGAVFCRHVLL
jgi:hypothetical protein